MKAVGLLTTITTILLAVLVLAQASIGVAGTVLNRDGLPIDGATVVVYDSNNNVVARSTTGAGGRFWLALPSGTYTLRLSKPGYVDRVLTFTIGKQTLYTDLGDIVMDYSLTVSLIPSQIELPVLSTASIPVSLSNKGASAENISVSVEKSCDLDVALYAGGMRVTRLLLGPGEAQSLTLQIKTPYMETTTCRVKLSFTGFITHVRELNVTVVNEPLNLISTPLKSLRATPGRMLQIPVRFANRLPVPFTAKLNADLPSGWNGVVKDSSGNVVDAVSLNPGESLQATLYLAVPREAEPKLYSVNLSLVGLDTYFVDTLTINVMVATGAPTLRISTGTPHVDAYAGKSAKYQFTVTNFGEADCLAVFNVTGLPQGYTWTVSDAQGNVLTQVYLPAGGSSTLYLSVSVPPLADPGALSFKLRVSAPSTSDEVTLSLGILGRYALSFVTQNFYLEMAPGSTSTFQLTVSNTGYSSLTNLALTATSVPSGFTLSIEPRNVLLLKPGESATFTLTLTTDPTLDAGDYYVTLTLRADQLDPVSRDLHVYVRAASSPAYVAAAVVVIIAAAVLIAFRRLGRR